MKNLNEFLKETLSESSCAGCNKDIEETIRTFNVDLLNAGKVALRTEFMLELLSFCEENEYKDEIEDAWKAFFDEKVRFEKLCSNKALKPVCEDPDTFIKFLSNIEVIVADPRVWAQFLDYAGR